MLKIGPEAHVASNSEVKSVLLLDGTNMGIIALVAKLAVLVAGATASHPGCICSHGEIVDYAHAALGPAV